MNSEYYKSVQQNQTSDFTIDENAVDLDSLDSREENFHDIEINLNSKIVLLPPKNKFHLKKCSTMEYNLTPITQISINLGDTSLSGTPPSSRNFSHGKFFFFLIFLCQIAIVVVNLVVKKQTIFIYFF